MVTSRCPYSNWRVLLVYSTAGGNVVSQYSGGRSVFAAATDWYAVRSTSFKREPVEMKIEDVGDKRMIFVKNVFESWDKIQEGNSKAANACERANRRLISHCAKYGMGEELLLPLLAHDSNNIRFAAAANLLDYPSRDHAIQVLRQLLTAPNAMIAQSAAAVLRVNKIPE